MIILAFTRCSNHSALGFKFKTGFYLTIYYFSLATVRGDWLLKMILDVCLFTNVHEINNQNKKKQRSCLIDLFNLFVACSSSRILKHRLNHIFNCHILRIFQSFQDTSCTLHFLKIYGRINHVQKQPPEVFCKKRCS